MVSWDGKWAKVRKRRVVVVVRTPPYYVHILHRPIGQVEGSSNFGLLGEVAARMSWGMDVRRSGGHFGIGRLVQGTEEGQQ